MLEVNDRMQCRTKIGARGMVFGSLVEQGQLLEVEKDSPKKKKTLSHTHGPRGNIPQHPNIFTTGLRRLRVRAF